MNPKRDVYKRQRQGDKKYRLGEIAEIAVTTAPKEMIRKNQNRVGEVTAMLAKDYSLGRITPAVRACICLLYTSTGRNDKELCQNDCCK